MCGSGRRSRLSVESFTLPRASNFVQVFVVQVDGIAKRANVPCCAWLGRSVTVDVALPFLRLWNVSATHLA